MVNALFVINAKRAFSDVLEGVNVNVFDHSDHVFRTRDIEGY